MRSTRSRGRRFAISSQSRHSARAGRAKFGERVRLRRSHRRLDDLDSFAGEDGVEVAGELAVAVADQEAKRSWSLLERPGELARLLGHPWSGRGRSAAGEVDAPATQLDE